MFAALDQQQSSSDASSEQARVAPGSTRAVIQTGSHHTTSSSHAWPSPQQRHRDYSDQSQRTKGNWKSKEVGQRGAGRPNGNVVISNKIKLPPMSEMAGLIRQVGELTGTTILLLTSGERRFQVWGDQSSYEEARRQLVAWIQDRNPAANTKLFAKQHALTDYKRMVREEEQAQEDEKQLFRTHPLPDQYFAAKVSSPRHQERPHN